MLYFIITDVYVATKEIFVLPGNNAKILCKVPQEITYCRLVHDLIE